MSDDTSRSDAAVILDRWQVDLSFMPAEVPGAKGEQMIDPLLGGGLVQPRVNPRAALQAVSHNGELAAVGAAVADGAAGMKYTIEPRFSKADSKFDVNNPDQWPADVREQHDRITVLMQAGFLGKGVQSLRMGFKEEEHDRFCLGWGGVVVFRDLVSADTGMPPRPSNFGRFEACFAQFTRPEAKATMVPVPVALQDGRVLWIEEPRYFRRIVWRNGRNVVYYKQFGDWRAMDARTGRYGNGSRRIPPPSPFKPGKYIPGVLEDGTPALEVAHWATTFPGAYPYGLSGWHSELQSVSSAVESVSLLLAYLKSGLHSVILAAANRPFEQAAADAATNKIDELGRGRQGLGALILLSLQPAGSDSPNLARQPFGDDMTADRGKLVLHELNTKLPSEVTDGTLKAALADAIAQSERIPAILLGKSQSYNFATASAAWMVVNRLRFSPHHEEREAFLDRILVEMGITRWRIAISSPEWEERQPTASVAAIAGQNGGISANHALELLSKVLPVEVRRVDEWWGELPMTIVSAVLNSKDPASLLRLLGYDKEADKVAQDGVGNVPQKVGEMVDGINTAATEAAKKLTGKS